MTNDKRTVGANRMSCPEHPEGGLRHEYIFCHCDMARPESSVVEACEVLLHLEPFYKAKDDGHLNKVWERLKHKYASKHIPEPEGLRLMEKYLLKEYSFDNTENRNGLIQKDIAIFVDGEETAHKQVSDFLAKIEPKKFYIGWNNEIYPKYEFKRLP